MFEEKNTGDNLPAQIDIYARARTYKFLFMAKGGGSANKTFLFQGTPSMLTHERMLEFLKRKILTPRHRRLPALSPRRSSSAACRRRLNLKTVKLASARYLDALPTAGGETATRSATSNSRPKSQADAGARRRRAVRRQVFLPRRAGHPPAAPRRLAAIGLGVSCSADRQALGKITRDGVFLEELERDPARFLPDVDEATLGGEVVHIDLNRPMDGDSGRPDANIRSARACR